MYPITLVPTTKEPFLINNFHIQIPKCVITFEEWKGNTLKETFGGKKLLNVSGNPLFAELAIADYFNNHGWEARWVCTYGKKIPICLSEWKNDKYKNQVNSTFTNLSVMKILAEIAEINNNTYAGCWDVVAIKNDTIVFAESKRSKKDSIRQSQINWLKAALTYGLKEENFLVVQWELS